MTQTVFHTRVGFKHLTVRTYPRLYDLDTINTYKDQSARNALLLVKEKQKTHWNLFSELQKFKLTKVTCYYVMVGSVNSNIHFNLLSYFVFTEYLSYV